MTSQLGRNPVYPDQWEPGALSPYNRPDERKGKCHLPVCSHVTVLARPAKRWEP